MNKKYISYLFVLISLFLLSACSEREQAKKDYFAFKKFNDGAGIRFYQKARSIRLQMDSITKSGKKPTKDDLINLNQLNKESKHNLDVTLAALEKVSVKHPYSIDFKRVMTRLIHNGHEMIELMTRFLLAYQNGDDISFFNFEFEKLKKEQIDLSLEMDMITKKLEKLINYK